MIENKKCIDCGYPVPNGQHRCEDCLEYLREVEFCVEHVDMITRRVVCA